MTDMVMSQSVDKLVPALLAAQKAMSNAIKGSSNPFFKSSYADLNAVREASLPALNENGFIVTQPMVQKEGKTYVRTMFLHTSGQFIGSDTEVIAKNPGNPQEYGSGISYARRYGLQALAFLGQQDDDAESAMGRTKTNATTSAEIKKTAGSSTFRKPGSAANGAAALTPAGNPAAAKLNGAAANGAAQTVEGWD